MKDWIATGLRRLLINLETDKDGESPIPHLLDPQDQNDLRITTFAHFCIFAQTPPANGQEAPLLSPFVTFGQRNPGLFLVRTPSPAGLNLTKLIKVAILVIKVAIPDILLLDQEYGLT